MQPTPDTQRIIDRYIERTLQRPKTTWLSPAVLLLVMLLLPLLAAFITVQLVSIKPWLCYLLWYVALDLVLVRFFLIQAIKCYQHYASDQLRRFCMCVPSCSEYAIAVLKKKPLAVAVYKIIYRLKVTCDGEKKLDLP